MSLNINVISEIPELTVKLYGESIDSVRKIDGIVYLIKRIKREFHLIKKLEDGTEELIWKFFKSSNVDVDGESHIKNTIKRIMITTTGTIVVICKKNINLFEINDDKCEFIMSLPGKMKNGVFKYECEDKDLHLASDLDIYGINHSIVSSKLADTQLIGSYEYEGDKIDVFAHNNFIMAFSKNNITTHLFDKNNELIYTNKNGVLRKNNGFVMTRNNKDIIIRSLKEIKHCVKRVMDEHHVELKTALYGSSRFLIYTDDKRYCNGIFLFDVVTSNLYTFDDIDISRVVNIVDDQLHVTGICIDNDVYMLQNNILTKVDIGRELHIPMIDELPFNIIDDTLYLTDSDMSLGNVDFLMSDKDLDEMLCSAGEE